MSNFVLSPDADEDVFQIWAYLFGRAGLDLANRIESELYNTFEALARMPGQGHRRPDLTDAPVLFFALYQLSDRLPCENAARDRPSAPRQAQRGTHLESEVARS